MSDEAAAPEEAPKKKSKLPLLLGLVLMLGLGGGGFYAVYSGMVLAPASHGGEDEVHVEPLADIGFVPLDPVVVSLEDSGGTQHLRFTAQLEVGSAHVADVTLLKPRILDVLNTYLRAVDRHQFEDSGALMRLRAQLLRRIQLVVGEGRVRDVLVTEFVIN